MRVEVSPTAISGEVIAMRRGPQWARAVLGLRIALVSISGALLGLILSAWFHSVGLTMLAIGMCAYLLSILLLFTGMLPGYFGLAKPRPSFWSMRMALLHDLFTRREKRGGTTNTEQITP